MTLSTLINASLTKPAHPKTALVLMGGGARTAYQAGVLKAVGEMLKSSQDAFPFQLLVGTSAGALNATFLASRAAEGLSGLQALAQFWQQLRSAQVYELQMPVWTRLSRLATAWHLSQQIRQLGALLDNMPLADTLHKAVSLAAVDEALSQGHLQALAITASSYSSGMHWTFCHTAQDARAQPWSRPGRRAEYQPITMEHLMASSAIPLIFPAQPLWVDGHREYFGDGSMRQTSPLSPALHLGAHKVLAIGVGQPERSGFGEHLPPKLPMAGRNTAQDATKYVAPGMGGILGHALASVFHDTLRGDVEQTQRLNATVAQLPREIAAVLPYRQVNILSIQPSQSLDDLARQHAAHLPLVVRNVLSALAGGSHNKNGAVAGAGLASYLLFERAFTHDLIALGERDAYAQQELIKTFFAA